MTTTTPTVSATAPSGRMQIRASYASLGFALVGLLSVGLGHILAGQNATTYPDRPTWALEAVGSVLVAIAVTLHIDHLSYRIGRSAVVLIITGAFLFGGNPAAVFFAISPSLVARPGWQDFLTASWGASYILIGLGLAAVAVHKEKQIERGLVQVADVGATDPADITVHASFFSLISASLGAILVGVGNVLTTSLPMDTREAWVFQTLGSTLVAVGIISHIEHLGRHIGRAAVAFGIFGTILMAINTLPYAIEPSNVISSNWGQVMWNVFGAGLLCAAIAVGLVILRKRSVEAESASVKTVVAS